MNTAYERYVQAPEADIDPTTFLTRNSLTLELENQWGDNKLPDPVWSTADFIVGSKNADLMDLFSFGGPDIVQMDAPTTSNVGKGLVKRLPPLDLLLQETLCFGTV